MFFFHMQNHYRKLKNVKSRVNSNRPKSAGRPKKSAFGCKKSSSAPKDRKERPPCRRNNVEGGAVEKNHINPKHVHHLPDKFKTTYSPISKHVHHKLEKFKPTYSASAKFPRKQFGGQIFDENEYIQFSLHVTEEIIKNEIMDVEEMVHVIKSHYQSTKSRLNEAKLLTTIKDLCSELNIAVDENLIQFLDNRSKYIKVCSETIPYISGHRPCPRDPIHTMPSTQNHHYYMHSEHAQTFGANSSNPPDKLEESEVDTVNSLGLVPIDIINTSFDVTPVSVALQSLVHAPKDDAFQFEEETLGEFEDEEEGIEWESGNEKKQKENVNDTEKEKEEEKREDETETDVSKNEMNMEEDENKNEPESEHEEEKKIENDNKYAKKLEILHDATLRFTAGIDKESECAFILQQLENDANMLENVGKSEKKLANTFVVSHYSTSIDPEVVHTQEFSVQTCLDSVQSSQTELVYAREWDATSAVANFPGSSKTCPTTQSQSGSTILKDTAGSATMTSAEVQYVLLDCSLAGRLGSTTKLVGPTSDKTISVNNYPSGNCVISGVGNDDMLKKDYDLTPQREVFVTAAREPTTFDNNQKRYGPSSDAMFLEHQGQQHLQQHNQAFARFSRMPNMAPAHNQLLSDKYAAGRTFKNGTLHHLERYDTKNYNHNLSFFYPTVATQVSSMDLLIDRNVGSSKPNYYQKDDSHVNRNHKQPTHQRKSQHHDTHNKNARSDYRTDTNTTDSLLELDIGESVVSSCVGYQKGSRILKHKERKETRINLDNYRLDAKRADDQDRITSERQEAVVDRDIDVVRAISPGQSGHNNPSPGQSMSVEEVSGRMLAIYHSNDSMEKRIKNLRHDIEKYGKDDIGSRRAFSATARRTDVLDLLKYNINSDGMSSEVSSPKSKRMTILRKQSNLGDS